MIFDPRQTVEPQSSSPRKAEIPVQKVARIQILFHWDLKRVGQMSDGGLLTKTPIDIGRLTPEFRVPWDSTDTNRAWTLDDPCISRKQMTVAWREGPKLFDVVPGANARLQLRVFVLEKDGLVQLPASPSYHVSPGAWLAVGDRLLLRLVYERYRGPEDDRLDMIGESEALWALRDRIQTVSRFKESVLVAGETGSGKERVSQALHAASKRTGRFLALNMSRINPNLADSELFGHVKGAFSGAEREKAGAFELAEGGTLFLDEIADVPLEVQRKLLRVLEEHTFARLGSSKTQHADVRIVAATNKALGPEFEAGRFRYDLFERLRALQVSVPALCARREDVPLLFKHFLEMQTKSHPELAWFWPDALSADEPPIPLEFMLQLVQHPWPGNVRELKNRVTATAAANINRSVFNPPPEDEAFLENLRGMRRPNTDRTTPSQLIPVDTSRQPVATAEKGRPDRKALANMLAENGYNQSSVATKLGISRTTLVNWMEEMNIQRAVDLTQEQIKEANEATTGKLTDMARYLEVSVRGLKLRIKALGVEL